MANTNTNTPANAPTAAPTAAPKVAPVASATAQNHAKALAAQAVAAKAKHSATSVKAAGNPALTLSAAQQWQKQFVAAGGTQPRGMYKAVRAVARKWGSTNKAGFVAAAAANGIAKRSAAVEFANAHNPAYKV